MSTSKILTTQGFVRVNWVNLVEPVKLTEADKESYRLQALWSKSGSCEHGSSDMNELIKVANEVAMKEYGLEVSFTAFEELKDLVGIQFPPSVLDGDKVKVKDKETGRIIAGKFDERYKGYHMLNLKAMKKPMCYDASGKVINGDEIESGDYCRLQIEVNAWYKGNTPIFSLKLVGVQLAFKGESFFSGGGVPKVEGFGAIEGGAVSTGFSPVAVSEPVQTQVKRQLIMNEGVEFTYEQLSNGLKWSDQEIVDAGYANWK